jgi:hypothetical protein
MCNAESSLRLDDVVYLSLYGGSSWAAFLCDADSSLPTVLGQIQAERETRIHRRKTLFVDALEAGVLKNRGQ